MNKSHFLTKSLPFFMIASVIVSLALHDTHLDKLAIPALALPTAYLAASYKITGSDHTHIEQASFAQVTRSLNTGEPLARPLNNDKRYRLQNRLRVQSDDSDYVWPFI